MKMVAAAKLRRAQDAILARPYAQLLDADLSPIAARGRARRRPPAARPRARRNAVEVVVITSDRGLAGGFNSNIDRGPSASSRERPGSSGSSCASRPQGREYFRAASRTSQGRPASTACAHAGRGAAQGVTATSPARLDAVFLAYNEFKSAISQKPVRGASSSPSRPRRKATTSQTTTIDFIYEPSQGGALDRCSPRSTSRQV